MEIPVHLDLFLKVIPWLIEFDEEINIARVYQAATKNWASQEQARGHLKELSVEEVLSFMQELAWQMHQDARLEINYKQLRSATFKRFHDKLDVDYSDLDAFYGEIRTCTFLTRDSLGNYKLAHKSFMEYFIALKIYNEIKSTDLLALTKYLNVEDEIFIFLIQFDQSLIYQALLFIIEKENQNKGKYALEILKKHFFKTLNGR